MATKRKRVVLCIQDKLDIVQNIERGSTVKQMCLQYNIGDSTVRDIVRNKDKLLIFACSSDTNFGMASRKTMKKSTFEELDQCMVEWFTQQRAQGTPVSGPICMTKAKFFYDALGMEGDFDASSGWFTRFKQRHGIRDVAIKGELLSGNTEAVEEFVSDFQKFVQDENLLPEQIYNADESGLYWKCLPTRTLAFKKEVSAPGYKASKERLTIMTCSNATGTHMLPLLVIGKAKKPRSFKGTEAKNLPVNYYHNKKSAWMNSEIFKLWFDNDFVPQVRKYLKSNDLPQKAVLLLDNAPSHPNETILKSRDGNICVKFLPPNVTALIQPMDQGVISALKRNYRSTLLQKRIEEGNDLKTFWKGYTILDAIYEVHSTWQKTQPLTIVRSWKKIFPDISEEEEFFGFDEAEITRITQEVRTVPGGEEVDNDNLRQWLDCDKDDHGYEMLSDQDIVDRVRGVGAGGEGESESEWEGESADRAATAQQQQVTHGAALSSVEQLLEYIESQDDALIADKIVLRNLQSKIKKKCFSAQKQKSMTDYFKKYSRP
jgi:hypothetical protein